ncbi:prephenate dehydratase [Xylographa carneopallida]|nr:prephenate dehydratase [Xylographa carneopallida]
MSDLMEGLGLDLGVVAYLGPPSSYTHQAALEDFGEKSFALEPRVTIQDIFAAVQSGAVTYGVVPFENSTNGSVVYTLDLFADRQSRFTNVYVCGEAYLDVHHCLLGHQSDGLPLDDLLPGDATPTHQSPSPPKPKTQPLTGVRHVKRIYSHPQAFGQCEAFLSTYLKGVERQEVSSTSKAAEIVAADTTGTLAAISSKVAAQVHDLDVLATRIEDRDDNTTRFFILRRASNDQSSIGEEITQPRTKTHRWKTLVNFTIDHHSPGALADALQVFKTYGLNLTSISSRPSRLTPWHYIFFVELEGRRESEGRGDVNQALAQLESITRGWRWHGSWEDRVPRRYN